jgi:3-oxoacyl-[acyl-carrier-protein] synthase II
MLNSRAKALTSTFNDQPEKASRPFDASRSGFVIAEGAGIIILEELSHAKQRGARIYAELLGYGVSSDAHHLTAPPPDGQGAYLSMKGALKVASKHPKEVGYINAHATSTPLGDKAENRAIRRLMCEDGGVPSSQVRISSSKGAMGHLLGASGSAEAIFTALALYTVSSHLKQISPQGVLPPTINFEKHDEKDRDEWDCDYLVNEAKTVDLEKEGRTVALTNSFGFGGVNASLVFGRV